MTCIVHKDDKSVNSISLRDFAQAGLKKRSSRKECWRVAIDQAFNETVEYYDSWISKAVPGYTDLFAAANELIPFTSNEPVDVLDLGAGTGLFASQVLKN